MPGRIRIQRRGLQLRGSLVDIPTLRVGFPGGSEDGVLARAVYNHYGTPTIPARPFISLSVRKNRAKYRSLLRNSAAGILKGDTTPTSALTILGLAAVADIQQTIVDLRDPPNAESTIRGKGSSNPLIDTGQMRQSVTFKVGGNDK